MANLQLAMQRVLALRQPVLITLVNLQSYKSDILAQLMACQPDPFPSMTRFVNWRTRRRFKTLTCFSSGSPSPHIF